MGAPGSGIVLILGKNLLQEMRQGIISNRAAPMSFISGMEEDGAGSHAWMEPDDDSQAWSLQDCSSTAESVAESYLCSIQFESSVTCG